ncbi:hypothetical protein [Bifidobacterium choloepi]|uniref:Uncharacterized protein n=1 Tax=Bifidobacterium choloepi TaxID=2614131 RepID=A0A6I5N413_9BIFI|nr:hypothetical protein [Bifidobacterium choloepi]NEG70419.1 hypothetical protein [Bifidobacterium choloepi]
MVRHTPRTADADSRDERRRVDAPNNAPHNPKEHPQVDSQNKSTKPKKPKKKPVVPTDEMEAAVAGVGLAMEREGWNRRPLLVWSPSIDEESRADDVDRLDAPVPGLDEARVVMTSPMHWYLRAVESCAPSARRDGDYVEMSRNDMPDFVLDSGAMCGVDAVVGAVVASSRWNDGVPVLLAAVAESAKFLSTVADRDGEGYGHFMQLLHRVRTYLDAVAREADPATAMETARQLGDLAELPDLLANPFALVDLMSASLAFALYDDTRMLCYDILDRMNAAMERYARDAGVFDGNDSPVNLLPDDLWAGPTAETTAAIDAMMAGLDAAIAADERDRRRRRMIASIAWKQYQSHVQFFRYDLLVLSGENDAADRMVAGQPYFPPFADAAAMTLVDRGDWEQLLALADDVLAHDPRQPFAFLSTDTLPYGWGSLREIALQGLGERRELLKLYRQRVLEARELSTAGLDALRNLYAMCSSNWSQQVQTLIRGWQRDGDRKVRNRVYEYFLLTESDFGVSARYIGELAGGGAVTNLDDITHELLLEPEEYLDEFYFSLGSPIRDLGWKDIAHAGQPE